MTKPKEQESIMLVMDKTDSGAKVILSTLNRGGFDVLTCSDPDEAIQLCQKEDAGIGLAIVDLGTPGLPVPEFFSLINPRLRVLLVAEARLLKSSPIWSFGKNIRLSLAKPIRRATLLGSVLKVASEPLYRTA
jgi:CheY-like chemotaxis protein